MQNNLIFSHCPRKHILEGRSLKKWTQPTPVDFGCLFCVLNQHLLQMDTKIKGIESKLVEAFTILHITSNNWSSSELGFCGNQTHFLQSFLQLAKFPLQTIMGDKRRTPIGAGLGSSHSPVFISFTTTRHFLPVLSNLILHISVEMWWNVSCGRLFFCINCQVSPDNLFRWRCQHWGHLLLDKEYQSRVSKGWDSSQDAVGVQRVDVNSWARALRLFSSSTETTHPQMSETEGD